MSSARANRKSLLARAKVLFARARATLSRPGRPACFRPRRAGGTDICGTIWVSTESYGRGEHVGATYNSIWDLGKGGGGDTWSVASSSVVTGCYFWKYEYIRLPGTVWKLPEPRKCGRASRRFSGMIQKALTNMAKRRLGSFSHRQPWGNSAVKGIGPGKSAVRAGCLYIFGRALRWQGLRPTERLPQALPHSLGSRSFQTVPGSLPIVNTNLVLKMSSAHANRKSLLARAKVLFARARATLSRPGRPAWFFDLVGREARTFMAQFGYLRKATGEESTLVQLIIRFGILEREEGEIH
ncbi:hypothetical protein BJ912DRAFT_936613 [Pholiota molesta]|nr:hypothetical protein BJ912DRAFT_936613 [Pholiota molesta]